MCEKCRKKAAAQQKRRQARRQQLRKNLSRPAARRAARPPKPSGKRISSVRPKVPVKGSIGVEKKFLDKDGALRSKSWKGEKVELLHGDASASAFAKWEKGEKGAGVKAEAGGALGRWSGEHETKSWRGVRGYEKHDVKVGSVNAKIDAGAAWTKEMKGARVGAEASANLVEGKVEAGTKFKIPFTKVEVTVGGGAEGYVGASAHAQAGAGYRKDKKGKSHLGVNASAGASLGLGGGLFGNIDFSW